MTATTGAVGVCRVQRLVLPGGGAHTWTVLGSDHRPGAQALEAADGENLDLRRRLGREPVAVKRVEG